MVKAFTQSHERGSLGAVLAGHAGDEGDFVGWGRKAHLIGYWPPTIALTKP